MRLTNWIDYLLITILTNMLNHVHAQAYSLINNIKYKYSLLNPNNISMGLYELHTSFNGRLQSKFSLKWLSLGDTKLYERI